MPRVLVIDDDKISSDALVRALRVRESGWEVLSATPNRVNRNTFWAEGPDLVRKGLAANAPIDLVLTDLFMPDTEAGYQVLARVKEADPTIMTILYTGRPEALDRERAYGLNVYAIVNRSDPTIHTSYATEIHALAKRALDFREHHRRLGAALPFADPDVVAARATNPAAVELARHTLSVVFWDIRDFSALTAQLIATPQALAALIGEYAQLARTVIREHNGIIDKFIGDGVMALFGHPLKGVAVEAGAVSAVRAALDFNARFGAFAARWQKQLQEHSDTPIKIPRLGCGIHTGEVIAGYIGTDRGEFTALGNVVNLAARVQDHARDWSVLTTLSVRARVTAVAGWDTWCRFDELPSKVVLHNVPDEYQLFSVYSTHAV